MRHSAFRSIRLGADPRVPETLFFVSAGVSGRGEDFVRSACWAVRDQVLGAEGARRFGTALTREGATVMWRLDFPPPGGLAAPGPEPVPRDRVLMIFLPAEY